MPSIRLRVYNTQNNSYSFDQDISLDNYGDIKKAIQFNNSSRYTDKEDRNDPFANEDRMVTGDVTIFESPASSKAGGQKHPLYCL